MSLQASHEHNFKRMIFEVNKEIEFYLVRSLISKQLFSTLYVLHDCDIIMVFMQTYMCVS